ncbi:MAG: (2R)-3-sulfolactate dehydrogenase (NADP+) [Halioglobus sp.]|jgi:(2R)-3-sulfolactate dehydrogenase (NADP+)
MTEQRMTLQEVEQLAADTLQACGASPTQAAALAVGVAAAERDGISSHGLVYVPIYCEHLQCGKVIGNAEPVVATPKPGSVQVDAGSGFAHAAINAGFEPLMAAARANGCAAMGVKNSYNCGVLALHTERLAAAGLLGIGFTNAPSSIAPFGGSTPVIGTNPFSLAVPGPDGTAFVIDQSASVVAKSEIMARARKGEAIPDHWAKDADGNPTTDASEALKGSMAPSGGYKGFSVGLLVEVMTAAVAGASLGMDASPFSGAVGGPPKTGQFFFALDPQVFSGGLFDSQIQSLCEAIQSQPGAQLPGQRRSQHRVKAAEEGIVVSSELLEKIRALPG